jgi:molybdenum cofactor synthesis domain-containing protein
MIEVGVLTISDKGARGEREDQSGKVIEEIVKKIEGEVKYYRIIPDEEEIIQDELVKAVDKLHLDLILTTGGTGLGKRDVTPEATLAVIEKEVPGISEIISRGSRN